MTEQKKIDGRTKRALDMAIARKQVSQESYRAVLDGELTLQAARDLGRDRGPNDTRRASSGPGTATEISRSASGRTMPTRPRSPCRTSLRMIPGSFAGAAARNSPRRTAGGNQVTIREAKASSSVR